MTPDQLKRYSRHILLPEVGAIGQERLLDARVLIVGLGGLGSPAALYLTAAGVGKIGLVDFDVVDESNLQRQILFSTEDVGKLKVEVAEEKLSAMNTDIEFISFNERFSASNAMEIIDGFDIILDGTDNFATRYLVNDVAVMTGKYNVHGSIYKFEGQVSVYGTKKGPCYRCLFPTPPAPGEVPTCSEAGVLGILPGQIAMIQATETIKIILGIGTPLIGRLMVFDALEMRFQDMAIQKNVMCPVCGNNPSITSLEDYEQFCSPAKPVVSAAVGIDSIDVETINERIKQAPEDYIVLDVRESHELDIAQMPGAIEVPLNEVLTRIDELTPYQDKKIVALCHYGINSMTALKLLKIHGFANLINMDGGIDKWAEKVDNSIIRY